MDFYQEYFQIASSFLGWPNSARVLITTSIAVTVTITAFVGNLSAFSHFPFSLRVDAWPLPLVTIELVFQVLTLARVAKYFPLLKNSKAIEIDSNKQAHLFQLNFEGVVIILGTEDVIVITVAIIDQAALKVLN